MKDYHEILVDENITVQDALKKLDNTSEGILFVVNDNCLVAALSDGDVRRWLLKNGGLQASISLVANYAPKFFKNTDAIDVKQYMIENHLYELCCDKNGNHVYQKLLKIFPKENNKDDFLYDEFIKISFKVSIIQQGATLLNVALEQGNENQKEKLCEAIVDNIGDLIIDKYGNYTIQTVFKLMKEKINEKIYKYIDENLLRLSKEKFSSNVIDKCIIKDYEPSKKLIQSIIQKNIIKDIIVDQYGNYVVQKALNVSDKDTCKKIFEQIRPMLGELHKTNIGKKIYDKREDIAKKDQKREAARDFKQNLRT